MMTLISLMGFQEIGNRGTQSAAQAIDKNGNLFFGMLSPLALACWVSAEAELVYFWWLSQLI